MSGGERQRIALGRALIRSPKIFLLDEPLSSLDAKLRIELRAELKRLQRELGYTFLMATPDFQEAMAIADTVIMLRNGRIVQIASPQELYDSPVDSETASFVGAPPINLVDSRIVSDNGDYSIEFCGGGTSLPETMRFLVDRDISLFTLGIRPENIGVVDPDQSEVKGTLVDIEPLGLKSVLTVKNDVTSLRLLVSSTKAAEVGVGSTFRLVFPGNH